MFQIELLANGHRNLLRVPPLGCGVGVRVAVGGGGTGVLVRVGVRVGVAVGGTGVGVRVGVRVAVAAIGVGVGVTEGTVVAVGVGVRVDVAVGTGVFVGAANVGVAVGTAVLVAVGVFVRVGVRVGVLLTVGDGVGVSMGSSSVFRGTLTSSDCVRVGVGLRRAVSVSSSGASDVSTPPLRPWSPPGRVVPVRLRHHSFHASELLRARGPSRTGA
jgi:hypothetical protein